MKTSRAVGQFGVEGVNDDRELMCAQTEVARVLKMKKKNSPAVQHNTLSIVTKSVKICITLRLTYSGQGT